MIKKLLLLTCIGAFSFSSFSQCDSVNIPTDYLVGSDLIMSGAYVINGTFTVPAGVTVTVTSYASNGCGELSIYADNIVVHGTINGDYAGYSGGSAGTKGVNVSSPTGHAASLTSCSDPGSEGKIDVEGGSSGANGNGPGGGNSGGDGGTGSGSKQTCYDLDDEAGVIGGGGGAGGGAGGSYGGDGSDGAIGGNGSSAATTSGLTTQGTYPTLAGSGGSGGTATSAYGTSSDRDIDLGSGGAGSGGGGRSFGQGSDGASGGAGGGMIFLKADAMLNITGLITANGANGGSGGNGGDGDKTADCCSDPCNQCDERTYACGAGGASGAGGGSGGGIFLESLGTADISGNIVSLGGNGGGAGSGGGGASCTYTDFFCGDDGIDVGSGASGSNGGAGSGGRIKIYVADCASATITATNDISAGIGNGVANSGTYEEVCGYVGLGEGELSIGWSVSPNPFAGMITVEIHSGLDFSNNSQLEVYNALGQRVNITPVDSQTTVINLSDQASGFYTVRIISTNGTEIKKILKK